MNPDKIFSVDSTHLSDEQLADLDAGVALAGQAQHLQSCAYCSQRLRDSRAALAAYLQYRDRIRAPRLPGPPKPWRPLEALIAQHRERHSLLPFHSWPVRTLVAGACIAASLFLAVLFFNSKQQHSPSGRAEALLERSVRAEASSDGYISMRLHGRTFVRPAVFTTDVQAGHDRDMVHVRDLFTSAHYSWREPLSARSFQNWRNGLPPEKRDYVSLIQQGDTRSYRVRTDNPKGVLRSASLMLRAEDLRPTSGVFDFEGEEAVEIAEAPVPSGSPTQASHRTSKPRAIEVPVGPEDALHVLVALNKIGADVGDPIELSRDPSGHVLTIHGYGLSADQEQEIREALKALPRVALNFENNTAKKAPAQLENAEKFSANVPPPLRQRFEMVFGGPSALQDATDRILDATASALAQAHALEVLAENFPPQTEESFGEQDRGLLRALRQTYVLALSRSITQIRADVKPLLAIAPSTPSPLLSTGDASWQASTPRVVNAAEALDKSLNRLLAGAYSETVGDDLLNRLPVRIEQLAHEIRLQQDSGK